ncbi:MAG: PSD1 domain-containing protein, partial [Candidatus Omnitrophica bacterium]|nr:PSD1 domain-containing protein [Candidatus Omnitrophota bacterium]
EGELERLNATKADLEKRLSEIQSLPASPDRGDLGEISSDNFEFFETHIRPVLAESCYACHGPEKQKAGLRLDNAESFLIGGESGPVFFPDDPEGSRLIKAIEYLDPSLQMPPSGKLPDAAIEDFKGWIRRGAPYPRTASTPTSSGSQSKGIDLAQAREWWSFQPVSNPTPPTVDGVGWASTPVDAFVLDGMRENNLSPAAPADKRTLIRRVTFDLTGLPPKPEEVEAFLSDASSNAFEKVVDRLLTSPAYGERWGRHWLDVVRYTDSFDSRATQQQDVVESYRYRDWVVNAFNEDMPYDRFLSYQIAGDLLPARDGGGEGFNREGIIATGMLAIGNWPGGDADKEKMVTDIVDDQIDVISRGMLGLTVACARCHDHKFDPITTEDYYGLAGIFFSSHILPGPGRKTEGSPVLRIPLLPSEELAKRNAEEARIGEIQNELESIKGSQRKASALKNLSRTADYLMAIHRSRSGQPGATTSPATDLSDEALDGWLRYLGFQKEHLLSKQVTDIHGKPGIHAWVGDQDAASLTVNTNTEEVSYLTIVQPGRSVAVHPSPQNSVSVSWKCPTEGTYTLDGKVRDLDSSCGDGVSWELTLESQGESRILCQGNFINGGEELFSNAGGADSLKSLKLGVGDRVSVSIGPKTSHACDTTLVDLSIAAEDPNGPVWDLNEDLIEDVLVANPHPDRFGRNGIWSFQESTENGGSAQGGEGLRKRWQEEIGKVSLEGQGALSLDDAVEQAAQKIGEALEAHAALDATAQAAIADDPIAVAYRDLVSDKSPFPFQFDPQDLSDVDRVRWDGLNNELAELQSHPRPPLEYGNGIQEGGVPDTEYVGFQDVRVHIRGRYDRLGDPVARRFPVVLAGQDQPTIEEGSGRAELARWVSSASNPLTARVLVNRVWQHHFGEGIVRTPANFGKLGEKPTHPDLLDWLARDFIDSGWSIKALHRRILLSSTYQQSSQPSELAIETDPDNRWLSHQNRRRLEAEAIRDAMLQVSGRLDTSLGGPPYSEISTPRKTLYFKTVRSDRTSFNMLFDAADPTAIVTRRIDTTVAPQALFLLNNPFVLETAEAMAKDLLADSSISCRERIRG